MYKIYAIIIMIQIDKKKKNYVEREQIKARSIIGGVILGGDVLSVWLGF